MRRVIAKPCISCDIVKPLTEFYLQRGMADGRLNLCKSCAISRAVERRRARWADIKDVVASKTRTWKAANRDWYLEQQRAARRLRYVPKLRKRVPAEAKRASARVRAREWYIKNKDRAFAHSRSRRARRLGGGPLSQATIRNVFSTWKVCAYCSFSGKLVLEHVKALSKGGTNEPSNLVAACSTCNSSKRAGDWLKWFRTKPFHSPEAESRIAKHTGLLIEF